MGFRFFSSPFFKIGGSGRISWEGSISSSNRRSVPQSVSGHSTGRAKERKRRERNRRRVKGEKKGEEEKSILLFSRIEWWLGVRHRVGVTLAAALEKRNEKSAKKEKKWTKK